MNARRAILAAAAWALLAIGGCDGRAPAAGAPSPSGGGVAPPPAAEAALTLLAGSETRDIEADLQRAAAAAGVRVSIQYAGTLEMVERVNAGEAIDAILPANGAYPSLALARKPLAREKLFYSRVALGVKVPKAARLGWDRRAPTWAEVAAAVKRGEFTFGMTNPTASNTGMSALFALASAAAGKTEDLAVADVDPRVLRDFLAGQRITAGSSGWLAEAYERDPSAVDGLVNYEAVILRLNARLPVDARLALVYPKDGVISADYPLMLLREERRDAFNRLVAALKGPEFQGKALAAAFLRPSSPEVTVAPELPTAPVAELSYPNRLDVIDEVLAGYLESWRRPATSIFVLDTSGSMQGARMDGMKQALNILAGAEASGGTARYTRFQRREKAIVIRFSSDVGAPDVVAFGDGDVSDARRQVLDVSARLKANGGTALYSALEQALRIAERERQAAPDRYLSIVLLTDGESNEGISFRQFAAAHPTTPVRIFPILFGEGNVSEMKELAKLSGGRTFDARTASLAAVFKEIRGYQ